MSFRHSINFNMVQDVSIHRPSSAVTKNLLVVHGLVQHGYMVISAVCLPTYLPSAVCLPTYLPSAVCLPTYLPSAVCLPTYLPRRGSLKMAPLIACICVCLCWHLCIGIYATFCISVCAEFLMCMLYAMQVS